MGNILIIGASGHAKVAIDVVEREGRHSIAGLLDQQRDIGECVLGYRILGREPDLPELIRDHDVHGLLIAIGDNFVRREVAERVARSCPQVPLVFAVHPLASVARDAAIGPGTIIMAGACVGPSVSIGQCCIINTNALLDHDSEMADYSSLAPGAVTGGNCRIGACSAICIGAVLSHGIEIGEHSVIGAGATVLRSIAANVVAFGTPARAVRGRQPGEKYL